MFGAVSLSAERATELVKKLVPHLGKQWTTDSGERWRKFSLRAITVILGGLIAFAAGDQIKEALPILKNGVTWKEASIIGLFSAAGSDMWSQALGYVNKAKDLRKLDLEEKRKRATA
ncbi:MAG: hypothetical protein C4525_11250 [Desulfarculus sp.]|nr:MAG: hypothetical protein C4525_11250 [Desulfarculus sp.]